MCTRADLPDPTTLVRSERFERAGATAWATVEETVEDTGRGR
jgi:hypothetical protein